MASQVIEGAPLPLGLRVVPDTSVIVEGFLSRKVEKGELEPSEVIIHEAVMAELESQANKNRETGFLGLEEVKKLRALSESLGFKVSFRGSRPTDFEIKHAKTGEIDSLIRGLAYDERATLLTADRVQSLVAESKGISVILCEFMEEEKPFVLEKYFSHDTMSVHIREGCPVQAKKGTPGSWEYKPFSGDVLDREGVKQLAKQVIEEAAASSEGFVESDRKGSTVLQYANYRIVITRPPFADGYEITAARPARKLSLREYNLGSGLHERISGASGGMLIIGPSGHGKTTFVHALAEHCLAKSKTVKAIESPRGLALGKGATQYSLGHGSPSEMRDILLFSSPDCVFFDEISDADDFRLFSELRLSGVSTAGVMHASGLPDAMHRLMARIDLGVVPHIIDTVVFIRDGKPDRVFTLSLDVRLPSGMSGPGLSRPVVSVSDFGTAAPELEIYIDADKVFVMPVNSR